MARIGKAPGIRLLQHPELRTIYLGLNVQRDELPSSDVKGRDPLKDQRVREASGAGDRAAGDRATRDGGTRASDVDDVGVRA